MNEPTQLVLIEESKKLLKYRLPQDPSLSRFLLPSLSLPLPLGLTLASQTTEPLLI